MNSNRVCIISIYIGKLPELIQAWIKSCGYNKEFDFILICDDKIECEIPNNLKIINQTIFQLKNRFQKCFDFPISLENSYKLCDYRAIYPHAFHDELSSYEWWGFCDTDMIFGNLKNFITNEMLDKYERIGMYGHLSLFKNSDKMNNLYKLSGSIFNYKDVFSNDVNYIYDETAGLNMICKKNNINWFKHIKLIDADRYCNRIREYFSNEHVPEVFTWETGQIFRYSIINGIVDKEEFAYIHISSKKIKHTFNDNVKSFYIYGDKLVQADICVENEKDLEEKSEFINASIDAEDRRKLKKIWLQKQMSKPLKSKIIQLKIYYVLFKERYFR